MLKHGYLIAAAAAVSCGLLVGGGQACAQYVQGPNGHLYKAVVAPRISWAGAAQATAGLDVCGKSAHLATITSLEEDAFIDLLRADAVLNAPGIPREFWVGGFQQPGSTEPDGGWTWVNGEGPIPLPGDLLNYENWLPSEPNNAGGREHRLAVGLGGLFGWNDEGNLGNIGGYIVEVDVDATVIIGNCDSGVPNYLVDADAGCTISDLIADCLDGARNHGHFVQCVAHLTNDLKKAGIISGEEKGRIQSCAAQADIP